MNTDLSRSMNECVGVEVGQFLSKVKGIYSTFKVEFEYCENKVFDEIMNLIIPSFKEDKTANSTILPSIVQTEFCHETQKDQKEKYCAKEIVEINRSTNLFGSPGSAFVSHVSNRNIQNNMKSSFSFGMPVSQIKIPFHKIIIPEIVKEECQKLVENNKLEVDCQGKSCNGTRKQYKIYSPELKTEIVEYAYKNGSFEASQKYHVSTTKICFWQKSFSKQKQTRGRKTVDPQMEDKVCEWIQEEICKGSVLTQRIIRERAKKISMFQNFKASKGWLQKFFRRRPALFKAYSSNRQGNLQNLQVNQMIREQQEKGIREDDSQFVSC